VFDVLLLHLTCILYIIIRSSSSTFLLHSAANCSCFHCHLSVLIRLKQFYANSSNLQYFKNLIKVPSLPDVRMYGCTENMCH